MAVLGTRDREILDLEEAWGAHTGAKEDAIRSTFGLRKVTYYQLLNAIIREPAAVASFPMLTKRLQREVDARVDARAHSRFRAS